MQVQTLINNQAGPLPVSFSGAFLHNTPQLLVVTGSLWSGVANQLLQLVVFLDKNQIGISQLFANAADTHMVMPTLFIPLPVQTPVEHTLTIAKGGLNVTADGNDFFSAYLIS